MPLGELWSLSARVQAKVVLGEGSGAPREIWRGPSPTGIDDRRRFETFRSISRAAILQGGANVPLADSLTMLIPGLCCVYYTTLP